MVELNLSLSALLLINAHSLQIEALDAAEEVGGDATTMDAEDSDKDSEEPIK